MPSNTPHPAFLLCTGLAVAGAIGSASTAIHTSNCKDEQGSSNACTIKNQVTAESMTAIAVSSLALAIAGVGFQLVGTRKSASPQQPPMPYPVASGPPNVPPGVPYPAPMPPPRPEPPQQG